MTLKHLFIVNCVIATMFGIALLFFPSTIGDVYGQHLHADGVANTRMWGSAIFGYAIITFLLRNTEESPFRRRLVFALFVYFIVGFAASVSNLWTEPQPFLAWTTPFFYLLLAAGYGYFHFIHHPWSGDTMTLIGLPK
jgi:hypothetical protein